MGRLPGLRAKLLVNRVMNKAFILELQQELLAAGYDDVELRYLSEDGKTATVNITHKGTVRKIGLFIEGNIVTYSINGDISHELFATANDIARQIFDRDPGTNVLPDFRKFTGFSLAQH